MPEDCCRTDRTSLTYFAAQRNSWIGFCVAQNRQTFQSSGPTYTTSSSIFEPLTRSEWSCREVCCCVRHVSSSEPSFGAKNPECTGFGGWHPTGLVLQLARDRYG